MRIYEKHVEGYLGKYLKPCCGRFSPSFEKTLEYNTVSACSVFCYCCQVLRRRRRRRRNSWSLRESMRGNSVCNACNTDFSDEVSQKNHYRSDWHQYNLRRKVRSFLLFLFWQCIRSEINRKLRGDLLNNQKDPSLFWNMMRLSRKRYFFRPIKKEDQLLIYICASEWPE